MKKLTLSYGSDSADDLRGHGWRVAIHNDYEQGGELHTFWLLTKTSEHGTIAVKGEGRFDSFALDQVRNAVLDLAQKEPTEKQLEAAKAEIEHLRGELIRWRPFNPGTPI